MLGLAAAVPAVRSPVLRTDRWMWLFFSPLLLPLVVGTAFMMTLQGEWYMLGLFNNLFVILAHMSRALEALAAAEQMSGDYARKANIAWDKCRNPISLTDNLQEINRIESGQILYTPGWTQAPWTERFPSTSIWC